jgi:hypothetical protein
MKPLDQQQIRSAMANSTRGEASRMVFPAGFGGLEFADLEYLGWRDPKAPQRGYLVSWHDDRAVGIALRAPEGASKKSVMCTLCRSTHSSGGVALFAAARAGAAGRNGNTVGTYICADLACSTYIRQPKATLAVVPEPGVDVEERIEGLLHRTAAFVDRVLG